MKRVICYANLNCFNSPDNITDEHMQKFFIEALREMPNRPALEVVDIIVDRYAPDIYYKQREGWQKLLEICKNDVVDTIIVPTSQMVKRGLLILSNFLEICTAPMIATCTLCMNRLHLLKRKMKCYCISLLW